MATRKPCGSIVLALERAEENSSMVLLFYFQPEFKIVDTSVRSLHSLKNYFAILLRRLE